MLIEKSFVPNEAIPLPSDTEILLYNSQLTASLPLGTASGCCGSSAPQIFDAEKSFLAVSASIASYVVLDRDLLPVFSNMLAGHTARAVLEDLTQRFGNEVGRQRFDQLLRNIVGRNFLNGAITEEFELANPHMQIYVTNRCNLRCVHCYMSSGDPLPDEIGTEDRERAIDYFAKYCPGGKITFTGGEALLNRDIFSLLERARNYGLRTEIYSNGLTIKNQALADRLASIVNEVQVSIDGASAATNDMIRGAGTFAKIVRGIRLLDGARTKYPAFRVRIAMTLTSTNVEDIRTNLSAFIESLGLQYRPEVRIGTAGKLGRAKERPELIEDMDELQGAQADIVNEFARSGMHRMQITNVNRYTKTCGMGLSITIGADGAIYPCTITQQRAIGNIKAENSEAVIASVKSYFHATKVDNVEGCRSCGIRYFCGGICRITNHYKMGSMQKSACTPAFKNSQIRNLIARYESFGLN